MAFAGTTPLPRKTRTIEKVKNRNFMRRCLRIPAVLLPCGGAFVSSRITNCLSPITNHYFFQCGVGRGSGVGCGLVVGAGLGVGVGVAVGVGVGVGVGVTAGPSCTSKEPI